KQVRIAGSFAALVLALASSANAQTITGSVFGTVTDPAGAAVVGATVELTHDISNQSRDFRTDSSGSFEFTSVIPGTYTLKITQTGFKASKQTVTISAQERVDVHAIRLTVGDVSTAIEVQGEAAHVATDSSDRAQNISLAQIGDT